MCIMNVLRTGIKCLFYIFMYDYVTYSYLVPEAKVCRSWHDYELGPRESKRRSGNIGIYFEWLVQAMEGERENTRFPEKRKEKEAKNKKNKAPREKGKKKKKNSSTPRKRHEKKKKKKKVFAHCIGVISSLSFFFKFGCTR